MWIFGYGSIVWRPGFEYVESHPGYVEGWTRRFWQHSTDHRGVPGDPGRVVTLLQDEGAACWGVVYRADPAFADEIRRQLDVREQGGYERHEVDVHPAPGAERSEVIEDALMYVATPKNPQFAGDDTIEAIAEQVLRSEGPSGHNVEYVLELADALAEIGAEDPHVFAVAEEVRRRLNRAG